MCLKTLEERDHMSGIPYASTVVSILYAMLCNRLDLSYALSVRVDISLIPVMGIRWLQKISLGLKVNNGYIDASFQTNKDNSKSQSGYVFT